MTLGQHLCAIATSNGCEKEELQKTFIERVKGNPEENLLMAGYKAASAGRFFISMGRNCLPPVELKAEGFHLEANLSGGFDYYFN